MDEIAVNDIDRLLRGRMGLIIGPAATLYAGSTADMANLRGPLSVAVSCNAESISDRRRQKNRCPVGNFEHRTCNWGILNPELLNFRP